MSITAINWAINAKSITPSEKLLLITLAYHASKEGYVCKTRVSLAAKSGISRRSVSRLLAMLQTKGLIMENTKNPSKPTCYLLNIDVDTTPIDQKTEGHHVPHGVSPCADGVSPRPQGVSPRAHNINKLLKDVIRSSSSLSSSKTEEADAAAAEERLDSKQEEDEFLQNSELHKPKPKPKLKLEPEHKSKPGHKPKVTPESSRRAERESRFAGREAKHPADYGDCPHEVIIDLYHERMPNNPVIAEWTPKRKERLEALWEQHPVIELWEQFFDIANATKLLTGRVVNKNTTRKFLPSLAWMIDEENFSNIVEGKYA